jgi:hypothetical protein
MDRRLRLLERRARTDLALRDRVQWTRGRAGDLQLQLAALLGDPEALRLLRVEASPPDLWRWVGCLFGQGHQAAARACVAAARPLLDWATRTLDGSAGALVDCVQTAQAWIDCPCEQHAAEALAAARAAVGLRWDPAMVSAPAAWVPAGWQHGPHGYLPGGLRGASSLLPVARAVRCAALATGARYSDAVITGVGDAADLLG